MWNWSLPLLVAPSLWQGKGFDWLLFSFLCILVYSPWSCQLWLLSLWELEQNEKEEEEGRKEHFHWQVLLWTSFKLMVVLAYWLLYLQDLIDSIRVNWGNFWTADVAAKGSVNYYPLWLRINEIHEEKESSLMSLACFALVPLSLNNFEY